MPSGEPAFLYVIGPKRGPHKVGLSGAPKKRLAGLQTGNPERLILKRVTPAPMVDASLVEEYAHWLLRESAILNEWFEVTEDAAWVALVAATEAVARGERAPYRIGGPGRDKLWTERLTLPLDAKTVARLDAVAKADGVARLDVIREGIARELKRRERPRPKPDTD